MIQHLFCVSVTYIVQQNMFKRLSAQLFYLNLSCYPQIIHAIIKEEISIFNVDKNHRNREGMIAL